MTSSLKRRLANRELTIGTWLSFGYPQLAEMVAKSGFDWVVVDMEHSATTTGEMLQLIQIIDLCGVPPLVRVGENDELIIKRVMDAGAHGVIVPMVKTVADAQAAADALYYPPKGRRGVGLSRAQGYGQDFDGYRTHMMQNSILIAQIEHYEGVENLADILALDAVDGFIIGPYDLSGSMGVPGEFDHPKVAAAIEQVHETMKNQSKPGGFHIVQSDHSLLNQRIAEGYRFMAYGTEMIMLGEKLAAEQKNIDAARRGAGTL